MAANRGRKLTKAPVGSIVPHRFRDKFGRQVSETYVIEPDRSLLLISRRIRLRPCDRPVGLRKSAEFLRVLNAWD